MLRFAKAIGSNTDFLTAQAFIFPKSGDLEESSDNLFLGVIISGSGEDVFSKVRQLLPWLEDHFTKPNQTAIEKVNDISNLLKEQLKLIENPQYLVTCFKAGTLYLQNFGNAKVFLLRNSSKIDLSSQGKGGQLISGHLKDSDKVLLISSKNIDQDQSQDWNEQELLPLLASTADNFDEDLLLIQHQQNQMDPIASILLEMIPENVHNVQNTFEPAKIENNSPSKPRININFNSLLPKILSLIKKLRPRSKKSFIIFAAVIIILLLGSTGLFNAHQKQVKIHTQFLSLYNQAKDKYSQAQNQKDSDPTQAQINLIDARHNLEQALKVDPTNSDGQKLKKEIDQGSSEILKIYTISDWPLFLSLDLIKKDFNAQQMSLSLGKIVFLDSNEKTLVVLDLKTKKPQILAGQLQLGNAEYASINGSSVFAFSPDKGLLKLNLDDDTPKAAVIAKPDPDWGQISDIVAFTGNIYILDSLKNQIYKYTPTESGYSDKIPYLRPDQKSDFAGAKKMDIDYSVWVLKPGPEILKFTGGYADGFSVSGMDKNLDDLKSFFIAEGGDATDIDNGNAYFLDPSNSRLVVLNKKGQYKSQYIGDKFKTASDFVVDEKEKKIYLLDSGKIYQLDLK